MHFAVRWQLYPQLKDNQVTIQLQLSHLAFRDVKSLNIFRKTIAEWQFRSFFSNFNLKLWNKNRTNCSYKNHEYVNDRFIAANESFFRTKGKALFVSLCCRRHFYIQDNVRLLDQVFLFLFSFLGQLNGVRYQLNCFFTTTETQSATNCTTIPPLSRRRNVSMDDKLPHKLQ